MTEWVVSDRESVEQGLRLSMTHVVISIRDPGSPKVRIPRSSHCMAVLRLAFDDAEPSELSPVPASVKLMASRDAAAIWRFIYRWHEHVQAVVCHCEMGMSRSPAVMAALAAHYGQDPADYFWNYAPNQYVYTLMTAMGGSKNRIKSVGKDR